jgi:hypothetical protein
MPRTRYHFEATGDDGGTIRAATCLKHKPKPETLRALGELILAVGRLRQQMSLKTACVRVWGLPLDRVLLAPRQWERSRVREFLAANWDLELEVNEVRILSFAHNVEFDGEYRSVESLIATDKVVIPGDDEIVWVMGL